MPALLVLFFFQVLRLLFDDRSNPANDATALSRQAEEFAASGNYSMDEKKLLGLVVMAGRQEGRDAMAAAVYLRRLAQLKGGEKDDGAAEGFLKRVVAIQEEDLSPRSPDR